MADEWPIGAPHSAHLESRTMKLHQIRYFLAICEHRSFTLAARSCGIAQPSLTIAIQRLESEIGGRLFDRAMRPTVLTELGELVRLDFAVIARAAERAARKASRFQTSPTQLQSNGVSHEQADPFGRRPDPHRFARAAG
jgi:DNA-binding transcriptional LysR family regulator